MIQEIILNQRRYFFEGNTLDVKKRIDNLKLLRKEIIQKQELIFEAFIKDFNYQEKLILK